MKRIKALLPFSWLHSLRKLRDKASIIVLSFFARKPLLSSIYYTFFSKKFRREHQAVLSGRLKYLVDIQFNRNQRYLLRRNIHRLEKGLLMRPRRDLFGQSYILETVESYVLAMSRQNIDPQELEWVESVLSQYFSEVKAHPVIDDAKKKFMSLDIQERIIGQRIPYKKGFTSNLAVSYDDLFSLAFSRKSVRWYLQKSVPHELIDKAIALAGLSPSACNRQPFGFRIFSNPDITRQIAELPMGTFGFSHNIPAIAVIVGDLSAFISERDRHLIYIDSSLACMLFVLALETLGMSSCILNWPDIAEREEKMTRLLNLGVEERPIMLIAIGYPDPDGMVAYSQRKTLGEIRRYGLDDH